MESAKILLSKGFDFTIGPSHNRAIIEVL